MTNEPQNELLYSAIEADLRQKILSGQYKAGEKLPTEAELCEAFGVSRITVRRAIQNLVEDDMLRRYRRKENQADTFSAGNTNIGFPCFTGTIHDTTHNGYRDRLMTIFQAFLCLLGKRNQVNTGSAAGRTGNKLYPETPQA